MSNLCNVLKVDFWQLSNMGAIRPAGIRQCESGGYVCTILVWSCWIPSGTLQVLNICNLPKWSRCRKYYLVLAMGPGSPPAVHLLAGSSVRLRSKPGQKPDPLCCGRVVARTGHWPAGFWPGWNRTVVRFYGCLQFDSTLAPIKYLSSDSIVTWSIIKLYSFMCSFASSLQICHPTNIRWIAVK